MIAIKNLFSHNCLFIALSVNWNLTSTTLPFLNMEGKGTGVLLGTDKMLQDGFSTIILYNFITIGTLFGNN